MNASDKRPAPPNARRANAAFSPGAQSQPPQTPGTFGIAAFRSRTQVLRMEEALRRAGVQASVISTPREVAIGCGLSVRFPLESAQQAAAVYKKLNPGALVGFYRVDNYGSRQLRLSPLGIAHERRLPF